MDINNNPVSQLRPVLNTAQSSSLSVEESPSATLPAYLYEPSLENYVAFIIAQGITPILNEGTKTLQSMCTSLTQSQNDLWACSATSSFTNSENQNDLISFLKQQITCQLKNLQKTVQLSDEEKILVDNLEKYIEDFSSLSKLLNDPNKYDTDENLIKIAILYTFDHMKNAYELVIEKGLFNRFQKELKGKEEVENILQNDCIDEANNITDANNNEPTPTDSIQNGLTAQSVTRVEKLKIQNTPGAMTFIGKVWDKGEGEGLYVREVMSIINQKGEQLVEPIGLQVANLKHFEDFTDLPERKQGQIDVELPLALQDSSSDSVITLPTRLGYTVTDIGFIGGNSKNIVVEKDAFGITYLKNVDSVQTVKYRLTKTPLKPIQDIPEHWQMAFNSSDLENGIIDKALEKAKTISEKINLIKARLKVSSPVYTTSKSIQEILDKTQDYFRAQEALGYLGDCRHQSICLANELRKNKIVALCARGLTVGNCDEGKSFRSDLGHRQTIYLDERGIPHLEEATSIRDDEMSLNEAQVEKDKPKTLKILSSNSVSEDKAIEYLKSKAEPWRQRSRNSDFTATLGTSEFRTHIEQITRRTTNTDDTEDGYKEEIYSKAAKLENITKQWKQTLLSGNLKNILCALVDMNELKQSVKNKISYAKESYPIVSKFLEDIDTQTYIKEFVEWYDLPLNNTNDKLHLELISNSNLCINDDDVRLAVIHCIQQKPLPLLDSTSLPALEKCLNAWWSDQRLCPIESVIDLNLEIAKQTQKLKYDPEILLRNLECVLQRDWNWLPSPTIIAKTCEILRMLHPENIIEEKLIDSILHNTSLYETDTIQRALNAFHESGVLSQYFEKENDKVVLTSYLKSKIQERCYFGDCKKEEEKSSSDSIWSKHKMHSSNFPKSSKSIEDWLDITIEDHPYEKHMGKKYYWAFNGRHMWSHLSTLLLNLEELGVNLKDTISPKRAEKIIQGAFLEHKITPSLTSVDNPALYTSNQELNFNKPVSLILAGLHRDRKSPSNFGQNIAFFSDYFNVDLTKCLPDNFQKDETNLWKTTLMPSFLSTNTELLSLTSLPKEDFIEIIKINPLLKKFVERTQLEVPQNHRQKVVSSLFSIVPEAKEKIVGAIVSRLKEEKHPCTLEHTVRDLIGNCIPEHAQYRFLVLYTMLTKADFNTRLLRERLNKVFDETSDTAIEENLKEELISSLPDSCPLILKQEIKNELKTLTPQELKVFSAVLAEDRLIDSHENIFSNGNEIALPEPPKHFRSAEEMIDKNILDNIKELLESPQYKKLIQTFAVSNDLSSRGKYENENHMVDEPKLVEDKSYYLRKKRNYPKRGLGLIHRVVTNNSRSHWGSLLQSMILGLDAKEEKEFLSTSGKCFQQAKLLASNPKPKSNMQGEPVTSNGNVSLIQRSGKSKMYSRADQYGEQFMGYRELKPGESASRIAKASFRTGDDTFLTSDTRDPTNPSPKHFVVDLEFFNNAMSEMQLSDNLHNLIHILCKLAEKKEKQHLHLFYRGELLFSIHNDELKEMLSSKVIDDDFGERTKRTDFILNLNLLAQQAKKINDHYEYRYDYLPGTGQLSNKEWLPTINPGMPSKQGTAYVLSDNKDLINQSKKSLFQLWLQRHIDTLWCY